MQHIIVLLDHAKGKIRGASLDALKMGQRLTSRFGSNLHALVLGHEVQSVVEEATRHKVASVQVLDSPTLATYDPDQHCEALRGVLARESPQLLLMGQTYQNIDLAPKLSASLRRPLLTDCIQCELESDQPVFVRQMFRSRVNARVRMPSSLPWLVTVQSGAYAGEELLQGASPVQQLEIDLTAVECRRKHLETVPAGPAEVDLSKADIVIGVGRGIKNEENLEIIRELATVLKAEIGASRPVVDNEWLDRERQIGSSGQSVAPRLYFACGISGAIQHLVGIKGASCTVAINTDANAPVFNVADYGIVGDLLEVVPELTRRIRALKESS